MKKELWCVDFEESVVNIISKMLEKGYSVEDKFILYPFGMQGKMVKAILNLYFGIQEYAIVDNNLGGYTTA